MSNTSSQSNCFTPRPPAPRAAQGESLVPPYTRSTTSPRRESTQNAARGSQSEAAIQNSEVLSLHEFTEL